jgi:uncharacterized protein YbjT (DUF2867 family)
LSDILARAATPNFIRWNECTVRDVGEIVAAAMAAGGVDHVFFTSGSAMVFYHEPAPRQRHPQVRCAMGAKSQSSDNI